MAESIAAEKLQPALLDRLTDDEPGNTQESREKRVLSMRRLKECVLRDLSWLLNSGALMSDAELADYPLVRQSVINYGLPDLTGSTASSVKLAELERHLREVVCDFEPRIERNSVRVRAVFDSESMSHNAIVFEIEGRLWAQPMPVHLFLKTELDLESGTAKVSEMVGTGGR